MNLINELFVQNPAGILLVAGLFFGAFLLLRLAASVARPQALLWPALVWSLWAVWEFIVVTLTPEANIRVDLLLILPLVLIVSLIGVVRLFVPVKDARAQ